MPYLVHSAEDREAMLAAIGVESLDDLLEDVPAQLRIKGLQLPAGLSELETMSRVRELAGRNTAYEDRFCFRGGGVYRRFIPAPLGALIPKPAVYTPHTPYQPGAR